jgi:type II secretory pathway predicted ATPase ExeA
MFEAYWGLQRGPFTDQSARQSLPTSPTHGEALARLEFLLESRSRLGLLLGPAGSGKSLVLGELSRRAGRSGAIVAVVSAPGSHAEGLLGELALELAAHADHPVGGAWQAVANRLAEMKLEENQALVLIDDLDQANSETHIVVERLLGIDAPLTIVASSRTNGARNISPRILEQVSLRIDLAPWSEEETREYLQTSLSQAGRKQPAFHDSAVRRLFELSGGAPRKVNQLAQLALLAGAGQKLLQVDAATIDAVEEELSVGR